MTKGEPRQTYLVTTELGSLFAQARRKINT